MRLTHLALAASGSALLLASCGGGDGLSKDDYVTQAEAICQSANDKLGALTPPTDPDGVQAFFEEGLGIVEDATGELQDLAAPGEDSDDLKDKLTDPLQTQSQVIRDFLPEVQDALASEDPAAAFDALEDPTETAGADAEADQDYLDGYGLTQCSELAS